jgi:ribosomal-protein-serine acetyltransferase
VTSIYWPIDDDSFVRTFTPDDAQALFALVEANRARLRAWMPWEETTRSPADVHDFIERSLASEHDLEGNGIWVDGRIAGAIGLSVSPLTSSGELGYWIGAEFEGRGLVTRACRLFIDHAFGALGLHRIELRAGVGNTRSRAVAERLGFTLEGTLREADRMASGRFIDLGVFGLLADEWRTAPGG